MVHFTKVNGKMTVNLDKELSLVLIKGSMLENGKITSFMVTVNSNGQMARNTLDNTSKT